MTVGELISKLKEYPEHLEVVICDGYAVKFYRGEFEVKLFQDGSETPSVDIGIGGNLID